MLVEQDLNILCCCQVTKQKGALHDPDNDKGSILTSYCICESEVLAWDVSQRNYL